MYLKYKEMFIFMCLTGICSSELYAQLCSITIDLPHQVGATQSAGSGRQQPELCGHGG